jgi:hypothetical protein
VAATASQRRLRALGRQILSLLFKIAAWHGICGNLHSDRDLLLRLSIGKATTILDRAPK